MQKIQLSHGGGGKETNDLIHDIFYRQFSNNILTKAEDAAVLHVDSDIVFTTDSFTVTPIFFNGGNIGKLSIVGTINDLAMMGAKPLFLSTAFIIEEGFEFDKLETIVKSMAEETRFSGAKIVCGDTKVVPKGSVDSIFINTAGIGKIIKRGISCHNIKSGDTIIVSGDIGRHGAAILMEREGIDMESTLKSDCANLWPAVSALVESDIKIKALRDATRGGLAAVLNEWTDASNIGIVINEKSVPVSDEVNGVCELLGFEPYDFANEGTFIAAVKSAEAQHCVEILKRFEFCKNASIIGNAVAEYQGKVILRSELGTSRFLELPKGELLPRIC